MPTIFWGLLLIGFGLSLILETVLNIDIPFIKIFLASAIIYWGCALLFGTVYKTKKSYQCHYTYSTNQQMPPVDTLDAQQNHTQYDYNTVFNSASLIDLRQLDFTNNQALVVSINTVFSQPKILLNPNYITEICTSSVFSSIKLPDNTVQNLPIGQANFTIHTSAKNTQNINVLKIKINTVFSSNQIISEQHTENSCN